VHLPYTRRSWQLIELEYRHLLHTDYIKDIQDGVYGPCEEVDQARAHFDDNKTPIWFMVWESAEDGLASSRPCHELY
jgi:hypothetical protein